MGDSRPTDCGSIVREGRAPQHSNRCSLCLPMRRTGRQSGLHRLVIAKPAPAIYDAPFRKTTILFVFVPLALLFTPQQFAVLVNF